MNASISPSTPFKSSVPARSRGLVTLILYALALETIPSSVTAVGVGVYNGIGNLIGVCSMLPLMKRP